MPPRASAAWTVRRGRGRHRRRCRRALPRNAAPDARRLGRGRPRSPRRSGGTRSGAAPRRMQDCRSRRSPSAGRGRDWRAPIAPAARRLRSQRRGSRSAGRPSSRAGRSAISRPRAIRPPPPAPRPRPPPGNGQVVRGACSSCSARRADPFVRKLARIGEGHRGEGARHGPVVDEPVQRAGVLRQQRPQGQPLGDQRGEDIRRGERLKQAPVVALAARPVASLRPSPLLAHTCHAVDAMAVRIRA